MSRESHIALWRNIHIFLDDSMSYTKNALSTLRAHTLQK